MVGAKPKSHLAIQSKQSSTIFLHIQMSLIGYRLGEGVSYARGTRLFFMHYIGLVVRGLVTYS